MIRDARQVLTEWLVLEVQRGSERAFTELHDLWRGDLRRLALVRVEQPDAADEVLTDVWLAIARGIAKLDDPACFPRWAFRIVQRRSADWVRRRQVERRRLEALAANETEQLAPAPAPDPDEATDEVVAMRAAIGRLPLEQQELLHLFYEMGRSVAEIADVLELAPGTVKSRLFSIRETLKRQLERQKQHE